MRKVSCVLLLIVMLCGLLAFCACDKPNTISDDSSSPEPTPADYFTFEPNSDRTGYILTGTQKILPADVVIPSEYAGLPVTEIGSKAFSGCSEIESVICPNTLAIIYAEAFSNCLSLQSIILSSNLWAIEESAFESCIALESINFPESIEYIAPGAFAGCTNLTSLSFPSGLQGIYSTYNSDASYFMSALEFPLSKEYLVSSVIITSSPLSISVESVEIFSDGAFAGCVRLQHIRLSKQTIVQPCAFLGAETSTFIFY